MDSLGQCYLIFKFEDTKYFNELLYVFRSKLIPVVKSDINVDKIVPVPCKSNEKDKEFDYNLLKLYRYLNLVE